MDNTQVLLARRPNGAPIAEDFGQNTARGPDCGWRSTDREPLCSLDAGFRNWMDEDAGDDVLPAMAIERLSWAHSRPRH